MQETIDYHPGQDLGNAVPLYRRDWIHMAKTHGWLKFEAAVIQSRREHSFFPKPKDITDAMREPPDNADNFLEELKDLQRRKAAGERFYGKADLAAEVHKLLESKKVPE